MSEKAESRQTEPHRNNYEYCAGFESTEINDKGPQFAAFCETSQPEEFRKLRTAACE